MPDAPASPDPAHRIPAATLVVFRRAPAGGPPQLLMLERAAQMRFAGGMTVFPGGRIDEADRILAARIAPEFVGDADPDQAAARIAAIRETLEETGLALAIEGRVTLDDARAARAMLAAEGTLAPVLDHFGWGLALDRLVPWARWCPAWPGAFDTRFFLADIGSGQVDLLADATESRHLFWASADEALAMADRGEVGIIFPTRRNLERLARFASFADAAAHAGEHPVRMITPFREDREGEPHLCIGDGHGYPVTAQPMRTVQRG